MSSDNMIVTVAYHQPMENVTGTNDTDTVARLMYEKAKNELGLDDSNMIYSLNDLKDYVEDLKANGGQLWEIYNNKNRLLKLSILKDILTKGGSSVNAIR